MRAYGERRKPAVRRTSHLISRIALAAAIALVLVPPSVGSAQTIQPLQSYGHAGPVHGARRGARFGRPGLGDDDAN